MKCEACQSQEATVHVTERVEQRLQEHHYCATCSQQAPSDIARMTPADIHVFFEQAGNDQLRVKVVDTATKVSVICEGKEPQNILISKAMKLLREKLKEKSGDIPDSTA